ncbi:hypothetical protein [Rhizobium sp.]|jgi:hypothetical protein
MAYLSTQNDRGRRFSMSRIMANADQRIGRAALVTSLLFIAALIVVL